jgi:hypothetical protein
VSRGLVSTAAIYFLLLELWMNYLVDLDPTHDVIRLTVTAEILTPELAKDIHQICSWVASRGGATASIIDLSGVTSCTLPADAVRDFAIRPPAGEERAHVAVARGPAIFGVARMFQLIRDFIGDQYRVVHSLEEAYSIVGVHAEDFTQRMFPKDEAA